MYFTLDKIDSVARDGEVVELAVQTDHRTTREVEDEGPLSTLFALAKVIGAARFAPDARVIYLCAEPPPLDLQRALSAADAELHVGELGTAVPLPAAPEASELLASAMALLARRHKVRDLAGFEKLESHFIEVLATLRQDFPDEPGVVEHPYWQYVLELSAVAGELLRPHVARPEWVVAARPLAHETLPFLYTHADPANADKTIVSFLVDKAIASLSKEGGERVTTMLGRMMGPSPTKKPGLWSRLFS